MTFQVKFGRSALKQFLALRLEHQLRFERAFDELRQRGPVPGPRLDVKPLEGRLGLWRLRVGNHRAIFEVRDQVILVTRLGDRKNVYRA